MADSSEVNAAVVALLRGDGALTALMPDGVFMNLAPSGVSRFVLVSRVVHLDVYMFGGIAFEEATFLIKAVDRSTNTDTADAGAARIHELLQETALTITGYDHVDTGRVERVEYTEVDNDNPDVHWQHRGGHYEVTVEPN